MAKIPELTADMEVIQKLGRRPNVDDGLTEAGFKAKFDEAGIAIKKFINEKVVPAINDYVVSTDGLLDRSGGTMTGDIAMSGHKVTGLGAPSDNADAANKGKRSALFGIIRYLASSPSLLECPYWFWRVSVSVRSLSPFLWHGFWVGCNLYFIFKRTKDD